MIIGPFAKDFFSRGNRPEELGIALIKVVEEGFGLQGENDVAFTAVNATETIGEAGVQIEVRYTAGKEEYEKDKKFDPSEDDQKKVVGLIERKFLFFFRMKHEVPPILSIWFKPYYNGLFTLYNPE